MNRDGAIPLRRRLGPLLVMLSIFAISGLSIFGGELLQSSEQEKNAAPAIGLRDVRTDKTLPPLAGGLPTVVHFWSTSCDGCDADVARLEALAERWKDKVNIVSVAADDPDDLRDAISAHPATFTVVADPRGSTAAAYAMTKTPSTAFVTANGQILSRHQGTIPADTLERRVRSLIAAGPAKR